MCFVLALYIHITCCFWYMVHSYDGHEWIPNQWKLYKDFMKLDDKETLNKQDWKVKYCITIYNAMLQLTGNDIAPVNDLLIISGITHLVCGALVNANVFGTLSSIFSTINRKAQKFQEAIDQANTNMKNMRIPENLQQEIREYMMMT